IIFSQNVALLFFCLNLIMKSSTFIHRTLPIYSYPPKRFWFINSLIVLLFSIVFFIVSISTSSSFSIFRNVDYFIWILVFIWPFIDLLWNEFVKRWDKDSWTRFQKRSKLEFNTKLGMHSPV
ncbi:hypothetical protein ROZALSC1DRAFT_13962, partial [Rozella allomycis CSF55]